MSEIMLDDRDTRIAGDPEHRPVRFMVLLCPCGKRVGFYVPRGPNFSLPEYFAPDPEGKRRSLNVWHCDADERMVLSVSPSIGLHEVKGHTQACHLNIVEKPFQWVNAV